MPQLIIPGPNGPVVHEVTGSVVTVGRDADNIISLDDVSVSAHHAKIVVTNERYVLIDCNSVNGTTVNGVSLSESELKDHDVITVGIFILYFQVENESKGQSLAATRQFAKTLLSHIGLIFKVFWRKLRRLAILVFLKMSILKLVHFNLPDAFYRLGRHFYEKGIHEERFDEHFQKIASFKSQIAKMKSGNPIVDHATLSEKVKICIGNGLGKISAECSTFGFKAIFVDLGKDVFTANLSPTIIDETCEEVESIKAHIAILTQKSAILSEEGKLEGTASVGFQCFTRNCIGTVGSLCKMRLANLAKPSKRKTLYATLFLSFFLLVFTGFKFRGILLPKTWTIPGLIDLGDKTSEIAQTEQDFEASAKWYQKAAEAGSAEAQVKLASLYLLGWTGSAPDDILAIRWYEKAAIKGNALGQYYLGWMIKEGRGIARNPSEASKWIIKSAKQGYPQSEDLLGLMYFQGMGVTQDYAKSAEWYRKAADHGVYMSQVMLGGMYIKGSGVEKNIPKGIKWMQKAADSGYPNAQAELGMLLYDGNVIEQDKAKGLNLLRKAADNGNRMAQQKLREIE